MGTTRVRDLYRVRQLKIGHVGTIIVISKLRKKKLDAEGLYLLWKKKGLRQRSRSGVTEEEEEFFVVVEDRLRRRRRETAAAA